MNILIITTHLTPAEGWGGVQSANRARVLSLSRKYADTRILGTDGCMRRGRITARDFPPALSKISILARHSISARQGFSWDFPFVALHAMRSARFVLIGGIVTWPVTVAALMCAILHKPFAVTVHGGLLESHVEWMKRHKPLKWLFCRSVVLPLMKRADFISVASEFERGGVLRLLPEADVFVTANAVDTDLAISAAATDAGSGGAPNASNRTLIYVGRFSEEKGVVALLKTWTPLATADDRLELVGSGKGPYAQQVYRLAASDPRVCLRGELAQLKVLDAIRHADALVLPSGLDGPLKENYGNVVAEALSVGVPVLVPRGISWDDLADAGAGIVFTPTIEGLRGALIQVKTISFEQLRKMRVEARAYAVAKLGFEATAAMLSDKIQSVLRRR